MFVPVLYVQFFLLLLLLFLSAVERRTDMVCLHSAGLKPEGIATLIVRPILRVQTY